MRNNGRIHHLEKSITDTHYDEEITKDEIQYITDNFFNKPSQKDVIKEIKDLYYKKQTSIAKIYEYYFYELMADCKMNWTKWTIKEFLESEDLIRKATGKIKKFPDIFDNNDIIKNLKTVFRLSASVGAAKLSNFPYKPVYELLQEYNVNNNYYDFSCGWGVRLTAALSNNVNYFGTDPNSALVDTLNEFKDLYIQETKTTSTVDIRCQGSEVFVPEWEGKIGVAFSSPPYFNLEEYAQSNRENQSTEDRNYQEWLDTYMVQTIENVDRYLVEEGFFMLNIKNTKEFAMYDDIMALIKKKGYKLHKEIPLKNITRPSVKDTDKTTNEFIMVLVREHVTIKEPETLDEEW